MAKFTNNEVRVLDAIVNAPGTSLHAIATYTDLSEQAVSTALNSIRARYGDIETALANLP